MAATDSSMQHVQSLYSHHGWLLAWLRRKLGHVSGNAEAADLAQDTFVRIIVAHKREQCGAQSSEQTLQALREPRAYLTTVASRVLFNHYRRLSLEQAYLQALEQLPEIHAMLQALPGQARSAFLLSQLEGMSYADIAVKLNVSLRTVKRYMAQAFEECIMQES